MKRRGSKVKFTTDAVDYYVEGSETPWPERYEAARNRTHTITHIHPGDGETMYTLDWSYSGLYYGWELREVAA